MPPVTMSSPLRSVVGNGATALKKAFDYETVGDLLRHYPRRYIERGVLSALNELRIDDYATVMAEVAKIDVVPMKQRRGKMLKVVITDGSGRLDVTFFNSAWLANRLKPGMRGLFAGKVGEFRGRRQLTNPTTQFLDDESDALDKRFLTGLLPIYPATSTFPSWNIAKAIGAALEMAELEADPLPVDIRERHDLVDLGEALRLVHQPDAFEQVRRGQDRLKFEEAFVLQTVLAQRRAAVSAQPATPRPRRAGGMLDAFDDMLPFTLTGGQQTVSEEIFTDIAADHPMHRLLQGEVGSGKTVVALRAMLAVVDCGGQAALLAPTEVLAQQHARTMRSMLGPLAQAGQLGGADVATRVALLTGSQGAAARRENLLDAASGAAGIVIGTHALLQENVQFADLGLVVVDEQHRFGVEQRDALRAKGSSPPHVLVMTATPIPRTVAMTVYGDLETSMLTELPAGRTAIETHVVPVDEKPGWFDRIWGRIREEVDNGRQVYIVCPRISSAADESDTHDLYDDADESAARPGAAAVEDLLPELQAGPLSGLRLDMLHGRMSADAKDDVMARLLRRDLDVLVATTVIEVGVDVPNATVMVVLDADRFGVSQLHQLRGRVGRGTHAGLCLLVTHSEPDSEARERLDGVARTLDGVELARLDLEQRREGDVLGAVQSGRKSSLRLLRLLRDEDIIIAARAEATALVDMDPTLSSYDALIAAVHELVDTERADYLEKA